jgi:hypothetical protein
MFRSFRLALAAVAVFAYDGHAAAQQAPSASIVGAWTLNVEQSDPPPAEPQPAGRERGRGGRGGRGGGTGGPGGGFGGRAGRGAGGPGGGAGARGNPEEMQRRRDAVRDVVEAPQRITITRTDSMVIITTGDGRTTRLATDGSKVRDESTGIERRTRWEGDRLVSEISGAARGKLTETYAVDPESHRLVVTLQGERGGTARGDDHANNRRGGAAPGAARRVYDRQ